jgi:hypothetical protein
MVSRVLKAPEASRVLGESKVIKGFQGLKVRQVRQVPKALRAIQGPQALQALKGKRAMTVLEDAPARLASLKSKRLLRR